MKSSSDTPKKEKSGINVFVLLFCLIVISAGLTYVIPAGEFERTVVDGRETLLPDQFSFVDGQSAGFLDIFSNIHSGMVLGASIIFFVLIVGGSFGILTATGALDAFITMLSVKMAHRGKLVIPVLMFFFACAGSLMGMSDETIVYIGILAPLAVALGFDAITGFAIVTLGASVGFSSAVMNPFTVGIAQDLAGLPTFSGIFFRIVLFIVLYIAAVWYVYRYAGKVQKDPSIGLYGNYPAGKQDKLDGLSGTMAARHKLVLLIFLLNFVILMFGVIKLDWYITEIAGLFLMFGVFMGLAGRLRPSEIADSFVHGAGQLIGGALIIGLAQTILVTFKDAQLLDTILYYTAGVLDVLPAALNAVGMFIFQLGLNFLVPSGSGQAALTMPIMAPLADMTDVTRQTAVLAFQLGDGMSNLIFPTVSFLMAGLAMVGISWTKWVRWVFPFMLIQVTIAIIALLIAQFIQYGPF
ncbi:MULTISPECIES: YfcC family protein [Sporosarcina]|uniref:YfcC family protein n=1 Tax=Sporosarcina TaxID=1569 RepID=UPI0035E4050C